MQTEIKRRLAWIKLYEQTGDAGLVCRKCGISRPTLRLWWRCYQEAGQEGLASLSRKPHISPAQKVQEEQEQWIAQLRQRRIGARRIQNELRRGHDCSLSLATIHKVLTRQGHPSLRVNRRPRHPKHRYERAVPGERVQVDTCKIAPGLYQYTAIDDCTRWRVLALYSRRSGTNSLLFLEHLMEEMPFPIGVWHQIPPDQATFAASQWQGRAITEDGLGRVLLHN
jgi:transposase-like protein